MGAGVAVPGQGRIPIPQPTPCGPVAPDGADHIRGIRGPTPADRRDMAVRGPISLESITVHCPTGTGDDNGAAGARTGAATVGCSHRPGPWPCSLGLGPWPCFIVGCGFLLCWSFAAETATVIAQSLGTYCTVWHLLEQNY